MDCGHTCQPGQSQLPPRSHSGGALQLRRLQVGHQGARVRLAADTDRCQRYRSVSPLCRPPRHKRFPRGAEHLRGLEAGGRDGDSADPRRGTPAGKGDQRHAQGNPRHSISAVAGCYRVPSRPSARPRDDAANLPDNSAPTDSLIGGSDRSSCRSGVCCKNALERESMWNSASRWEARFLRVPVSSAEAG